MRTHPRRNPRRNPRPTNSTSSTGAVLAVVLATLTASCSGSDDTPPTAEELAGMLIAPDTFADVLDDGTGVWTVNVPPDQPEYTSGVVPDEMQELLPSLELCPAASDDARAAVESLRWKAFRQLDLDVADPIEPPADRSGHLVFVQEFLTADDVRTTERTFDLLVDGLSACLGDIPAGEEGPGTLTEVTVPDIGDDRYGVLMVVAEAGAWAEWRIHQVLVRDGPILALFGIVDIRADRDPLFDADDLDRMLDRMADRLDG